MQTALYAILHMLVDGACAYAMLGWFTKGEQGYLNILLYNFCAFALQMPFGTVLDFQRIRAVEGMEEPVGRNEIRNRISNKISRFPERLPYWYVAAGVALTILGTLTHPVILGIGNALFHVGGGVDVIREDFANHRKGSALGVFVAPGALGLYVGGLAAKSDSFTGKNAFVILLGIAMLVLVLLLLRVTGSVLKNGDGERKEPETFQEGCGKGSAFWVGCLLVVILRSYVGMAVSFPWKTTVAMGIFSMLAVVLGKMAGGFLAAALGTCKVMIISLLLATGSFLFCRDAVFGIAALVFFNMTMPITLYMLVERYRRFHGFAFGLLTFGLFLGFLPTYLGINLPLPGNVLGSVGSLVSLLILVWIKTERRKERIEHGGISA